MFEKCYMSLRDKFSLAIDRIINNVSWALKYSFKTILGQKYGFLYIFVVLTNEYVIVTRYKKSGEPPPLPQRQLPRPLPHHRGVALPKTGALRKRCICFG